VTSSFSPRLRKLWRDLGTVEGFMEGASIFGASDDDRAYFVNGTQVANVIDDPTIELRLTRKAISAHRARFKSEPHVILRRSGSDWFAVTVVGRHEHDLVMELAPEIARAHWPANELPLKPPPEGAELARRRRFH
jgi:hypothetical protein